MEGQNGRKEASSGRSAGGTLFEGTAYQFVRELGEGESSRIYLVEHRAMGARQVAKVLRPELAGDEGSLERFRREARSLGKLSHPNIVPVDGAGTTADGRPFLVFQYLQGQTLAERLAAGPLPPDAVLALGSDVLSALTVAHEQGILHRHICPNNLLLHDAQESESTPRTVLLDFGWAKVAPGFREETRNGDLTTSAYLVGEPGYSSPELAAGGSWDAAEDVYSVAIVLLKSLLGEGVEPTLAGVAASRALRKGPLVAFRRLFEKALDTQKPQRFQSAEELLAALLELETHLRERRTTTSGEASRKDWAARLLVPFALALAVGALVAVLIRGLW